MSNDLPHETTICNDRDPPWINKDIKQLILDKHHAYINGGGLENFAISLTKNQSPKYLFDKIPTTRMAYRTRTNINSIPWFNVKHTLFKNLFFPFTVIEWNNLDKSKD